MGLLLRFALEPIALSDDWIGSGFFALFCIVAFSISDS
jgi:hypothetical protein